MGIHCIEKNFPFADALTIPVFHIGKSSLIRYDRTPLKIHILYHINIVPQYIDLLSVFIFFLAKSTI